MSLITSFLVFFLLFTFFLYGNSQTYNEEGWFGAGKYMNEAINETADACNDFYNFACGNWDKKYSGKYENEGKRAIEDTAGQLREAIKAIRPHDPSTPNYQKRLKLFYDQCVNSTDDEDTILQEAYRQLEKIIGPMPLIAGNYNQTNPNKLLGQIQQYFNTSVLVLAGVERQAVGCGFGPILAMRPATLSSVDQFSFNSSVTKWLRKMASMQKGDTNNFGKQIKTLASFEDELILLTENSSSLAEIHEVDKLALEFNQNTSALGNWSDYFQGLLPEYAYKLWRSQSGGTPSDGKEEKSIKVKLYKASYFHQLDNLIAEYGPQTLLDYAYWRAMNNYLNYFIEPPRYYNSKNVMNASNERECVDYVFAYASAAAARLLFVKQGSDVDDWKYDIELIVQAVMSAFRYAIYNTDILKLDDKVTLMNKLKTITVDSGVPEWLLDDKAVEDHTPAFDPSRSTFENDFKMFRDKFIWTMRSLWRSESDDVGEGDAQPDTLMNPEPNFMPDARYVDRRLEITLGALLPPLYDASFPLALKFGSLGGTVGEELMRGYGFSDIGTVLSILLKKQQSSIDHLSCFAYLGEFSTECLPPGNSTEKCKSLDVDNLVEGIAYTTLTEGMKMAYMAYAFMAQTVGREPSLPGLSDYDADQLYFLSYARFLCGNPPETMQKYLSQFPAFSKAFNCKVGDRYFSNVSCSFWSSASDTFIARRTEE